MKVPNALAHTLQSRMLVSQGRYQEAVVEAEKAVALDGNKSTAYAGLANALILAGKPAEGADLIRKSMRLDPYHPPGHLITLGQAQFDMEQFKEAAATFERAVKRNVDDDFLSYFQYLENSSPAWRVRSSRSRWRCQRP